MMNRVYSECFKFDKFQMFIFVIFVLSSRLCKNDMFFLPCNGGWLGSAPCIIPHPIVGVASPKAPDHKILRLSAVMISCNCCL